MENEQIVNDILDSLIEFDIAVVNYEKDHSSQNRKAFIETHRKANMLIKSAPNDVREIFSKSWDKITMIVRGLQSSSYSFSHITTFGTESRTAEAQLIMIKGELGMIMKELRDYLNPVLVAQETESKPIEEVISEEPMTENEDALLQNEDVTREIDLEAVETDNELSNETENNETFEVSQEQPVTNEESVIIEQTIAQQHDITNEESVIEETEAVVELPTTEESKAVQEQSLVEVQNSVVVVSEQVKENTDGKDDVNGAYGVVGMILSFISIALFSSEFLPFVSLFFSFLGIKSKKHRISGIVGALVSILILAVKLFPIILVLLLGLLILALIIIAIPVALIALLIVGITSI